MSQVDNKKLSVNTVEQALFYLFGQDYRTSTTEPRPSGKGRGVHSSRWTPCRHHYSPTYAAEDEDTVPEHYEPDYPDEPTEASTTRTSRTTMTRRTKSLPRATPTTPPTWRTRTKETRWWRKPTPPTWTREEGLQKSRRDAATIQLWPWWNLRVHNCPSQRFPERASHPKEKGSRRGPPRARSMAPEDHLLPAGVQPELTQPDAFAADKLDIGPRSAQSRLRHPVAQRPPRRIRDRSKERP